MKSKVIAKRFIRGIKDKKDDLRQVVKRGLDSEKISLKWKIFLYFITFSAIMLIVLWVLQTIYLEDFYKSIKRKEMKSLLNSITEYIEMYNDGDISDDAEVQQEIRDIDKEVCVVIVDKDGNTEYSLEGTFGCILHTVDKEVLSQMFEEARKADEVIQISEKEFLKRRGDEPGDVKDDKNFNDIKDTDGTDDADDADDADSENNESNKGDNSDANSTDGKSTIHLGRGSEKPDGYGRNSEQIVFGKYYLDSKGMELGIFVCTDVSPVNATVHTIRFQMIYISLIMVLLSLLLALVVSSRISGSIIKINESAKELSKGNYDVRFEGKDYKEASELSKTLNKTAKELSKVDDVRRELIANVSHDLRTPLTMIKGYAEMMIDIPGENTPENVQVIIDEAGRLTGLVNDMLDISKIESGIAEIDKKTYDITESIKKIIGIHAKFLEHNGYDVWFEYKEHVFIRADEYKINQVIYNLLGNAVNYTGDDKEVKIIQKVKNGKVKIEVKDTGEGIPEDELDNVWNRYYKIDKNHRRAVIGTGLGLSIVKNVLELHDAEYGVISEVGKGSTFWFEMDVVEKPDSEDDV